MPKSSLYQRMKVTLSWALGMLISQGRLTVELASAVITVTLPPAKELKKEIRLVRDFWRHGTMVSKNINEIKIL